MKKLIKKFINIILKANIFLILKEIIEKNSYFDLKINNTHIHFFCPNALTKWRVETFYDKEPETIEWINNFEKNKKNIFWDIGANIGLYSIYASIKFNNINVISFEPSTSNLRILSRNLYINNLHDKIKIFQIPLNDISNRFSKMEELYFLEGGAMNNFGDNLNYERAEFFPSMKYSIFGTNINTLVDQKILDLPNYIKIDVDGIEHLILQGANKYLNSNIIKEILVEVNENFPDQKKKILDIMKKNNFYFKWKKNNLNFIENKELEKTFNYLFSRKN